MNVEPHATMFVVECPECHTDDFLVVTIPALATGEFHPQFGGCGSCGFKATNMSATPPYKVKSTCCGDSVSIIGQVTMFYRCDGCGEPCDIVIVDE